MKVWKEIPMRMRSGRVWLGMAAAMTLGLGCDTTVRSELSEDEPSEPVGAGGGGASSGAGGGGSTGGTWGAGGSGSTGGTGGGGDTSGSGGAGNAGSCELRLVPFPLWDGIQISNDGLTASTTVTMDIAHAAASHVGGRWYFEVTIDAMPDGTWWAQNIGAVTQDAMLGSLAHMGVLYNKTGNISEDWVGFGLNAAPFGTGDRIGVALELDQGRAYFSKNGVWTSGMDPEAKTGGLEFLVVPGTGAYYPVLQLSEGDMMTANFGASPFVYGAPFGYAPFISGFQADSGGKCIDEGPEGIPAPPAPMQSTCMGGEFTSYRSPSQSSPELHVMGVYEPPTPGGTIDVHVARTGKMVLALSSYEVVHWKVTVEPGANLQRIVVNGFKKPTVTAPPGIPISVYSVEAKKNNYLGIGFRWPNDTGGGDTPALIEAIEAKTALEMTSFGGCYNASSFVLLN